MSVFRSTLAGLASLCALVGALAVLPLAASAEECPNAAFRTGPSTHLPDCRAYEQVTPPYKASAATQRVFAMNPSGSPLTVQLDAAIEGAEGFPNVIGFNPAIEYTVRRTASGWASTPDDPPSSEYLPYLLRGFEDYAGVGGESPAGQATVWMDRGVWQPDNRLDFFMRNPDRSLVDIGPALPPTTEAGSPNALGKGVVYPDGLSSDASHVFFSLGGDYWPFDDTVRGTSLYEYGGAGNTTPLLVGVDNKGGLISQCGVVLGGLTKEQNVPERNDSVHNAVSTDGNTVFFTPLPKTEVCQGSTPPVIELYARVDNGLSDAHTVAISEPSKEDCSACDTEAGVLADAHFEGASVDGSKVFFTTTQPLLGGDASRNVYEYDFHAPAGERVIHVSAEDATVANPAAEVVKTEGSRSSMSSEDGSHVYFIATGVLTRTPNVEGETAERGAYNLYVFERDGRFPAGHVAFVARLSQRDLIRPIGFEAWAPDVTPDGRYLVFASERDLTPDDTSTARQIFEYDAQTGALVRVSIGQDGFNHDGNVSVRFNPNGERVDDASIVSPSDISIASGADRYAEGSEGGYSPPAYSTHQSVSADGAYVFFQSTVGLTPQAPDQQVIGHTEPGPNESQVLEPIYANNVYEYHAGLVSLISDGQDLARFTHQSVVELLGTSMSGGDVFFSTADRLVGQDTDTNMDIYDARIDGGFPAPAEPSLCSGDACQGPLGAAPALLSPGSAFQAGGNPPLAGGPAVKPKQKAKKRKPGRRSGKGHAKRRGRRATRAVVGGSANRKAGRS